MMYNDGQDNGPTPYRPLSLMRDERMTDYECDDFIGIWHKFVPAPFCDQLIKWFEDKLSGTGDFVGSEDYDWGENDPEAEHQIVTDGDQQYGSNMKRKDKSVLVNYCNDRIAYQCNQFLKSCVGHYIDEFGQLKGVPLFSSDLKMQKTSPGGGYHLWHYENSAASHACRELVWMIYLNDIPPEAGGETEFLYQHRRLQPTKGTVVVFPAGYTHVHKGNTVLSGDKYILTGWYIKSAI